MFMILILRGHIRNSFETKCLYNLIKKIHMICADLKIFIHTWNIFANNISWRNININEQPVNDKIIYEYFDDLKDLIQEIIIDDDNKINLIGNLNGNINNGPMPIIGWKNYWYGKHKILDYLYNKIMDKNVDTITNETIDETIDENIDENIDEMIINCRFDIISNSNSFCKEQVINFINKNSKTIFKKNIFIYNDEKHFGIDNIYLGNINTMYKLTNIFFNEFDDILVKHNDTIHQEFLVYRINNILFD